jgi:serine/threonine protein kinase
VQVEGDQLTVVDNDSTSGTYLNGKRLTQPQPLHTGDVIRVGDTQLRVQSDDSTATTVPPGARLPGEERLTDLTGKTIAHFEVGPLLAKAQRGVVFKARDTKDDRDVALKVFYPEFSRSDEEIQRFIRAMKTVLALAGQHPNLVAPYGAGKTGPYCWTAMEYVEGESLTQVIQRIGTAGMLDWRNALRVAVHIGRALQFAQQHGIVHRNLTPQNVLVRSSDKLTKLGDLLLAKALEGELAEQITRPGQLLGDPRYMSPERTRGTEEVDGRSDIYSLGALVYALLTGRPPLEGDTTQETIAKIRQAEPVKPTKYQLAIPGLFEGTVLRMLAKRPEDRYQTADDLLTDLERVVKFTGATV